MSGSTGSAGGHTHYYSDSTSSGGSHNHSVDDRWTGSTSSGSWLARGGLLRIIVGDLQVVLLILVLAAPILTPFLDIPIAVEAIHTPLVPASEARVTVNHFQFYLRIQQRMLGKEFRKKE